MRIAFRRGGLSLRARAVLIAILTITVGAFLAWMLLNLSIVGPTAVLSTEFPGRASAVVVSPDNSRIAVGMVDADSRGILGVRLWNVSTRSESVLLEAAGWVNALAFTPDNETLIAGTGWDACRGSIHFLRGETDRTPLGKHWGAVTDVAVSPDGKTFAALVCELARPHLLIGDRDSGTVIRQVDFVGDPHVEFNWRPRGRPMCRMAYSPRGNVIAVAMNGFPKIWPHQLGSEASWVELIDPINGDRFRAIEISEGPIEHLAFSHDGTRLLVNSTGGNAIWRLDRQFGQRATHEREVPSWTYYLTPAGNGVVALGYWNRRYAESVFAAKNSIQVSIWDIEEARWTTRFSGVEGDIVTAFSVSPDGRYLVTATWNRAYLFEFPKKYRCAE